MHDHYDGEAQFFGKLRQGRQRKSHILVPMRIDGRRKMREEGIDDEQTRLMSPEESSKVIEMLGQDQPLGRLGRP